MRLQGGNLCHRHCTFSKFIRAKGISFVNKSIYCREMGAAQKKKVQPPRGQHFRLRHYPGQPPIVGNPGLSKSITAMRQFFTHCQHTETNEMFGRRGRQHIQSDGIVCWVDCQYIQTDGMFGRIDCRMPFVMQQGRRIWFSSTPSGLYFRQRRVGERSEPTLWRSVVETYAIGIVLSFYPLPACQSVGDVCAERVSAYPVGWNI